MNLILKEKREMHRRKNFFYQCFLCKLRNQIINQEAIQNQDQQVIMVEKMIIKKNFRFSMNMFTKVSFKFWFPTIFQLTKEINS